MIAQTARVHGQIAEFLERIGAPGTRFGSLFRQQRHGAVDADGKDFLVILEIGIGALMTHKRAIAAKACGDLSAGFGVCAYDAWQRQ